MSYILDALRRAQAERGRGSVPGLHTPVASVAGLSEPPARAARGLAWTLAALLLAMGLAGAGWWAWRMQAAPAAPVAPAPAVVAAPAPAPVVVAPAPAPTPVAPVEQSAVAAQAERAEPRTPPPARAERRAADAVVVAPRRAPARAESSAAEAAAPVYAQADLPPAVREQLPTLQLAGVTYSANPRHRMVIVNGQVLHEGDQAAPGLVLERIERERTVWAFRGYRYALPSQ